MRFVYLVIIALQVWNVVHFVCRDVLIGKSLFPFANCLNCLYVFETKVLPCNEIGKCEHLQAFSYKSANARKLRIFIHPISLLRLLYYR